MENLTQEQIDKNIQELIPQLQRRASTFCKNREESDELFQESFLKIWANRTKFTYNESLKAWCYKIMFNTFVDMYKDGKKKVYFDTSEEDTGGLRSETMVDLKQNNTAESSITMEDIENTIKEVLSPIDQIIVNRILAGYKQAEVAEELKLERNNVKQHYFQAIRKVREALTTKFDLDPSYGINNELISVHKVYRRRKQSKEANHRKKFEK